MRARPILASLSIAFVVLALLAVIAGDRASVRLDALDLHALASDIEQENDHLLPDSVRTLLTSGPGLQVIDLRDSAAYAVDHIPGAVRSTLGDLLDLALRKDLPILLYSDGGTHAAQGWLLLRAKGYSSVYSLLGGWKAWGPLTNRNPSAPSQQRSPARKNDSTERERLRGEC